MNTYDTDLKKEDFQEKYLKLKDEFETYQNFAESTIQIISEKNTKLEKKLDSMTNIVEISKYINSYLSKKNLIPMINDMIIGILGATYSSIYLMENGELSIKATNHKDKKFKFYNEEFYSELINERAFIMNCKSPLFSQKSQSADIHSLVGVPIELRERFLGYIIVEHALNNFFSHDHVTFISTIANQIAIALENNTLYNQIRENSIRDPLLRIYNRKYFFDVLENKLNEDPHEAFAIVMLDLDNFKKTNDLYGHQVGDEVLKQTTKIVQNNLEEYDILSRYGGEEIVIYINSVESIQLVYKKVDKIRKRISENIIKHGDISLAVTASFGISYYPVDGENLQEVISVADIRLYEAKKTGKNKVVNR